jgi:hypothetical protein
MQNSKEKEKATRNEVEIKPSNFYIYGYELCQKLAYIRDEIEMHDQLPITRSFSCHYTFAQSCNRNNENFHLKLLVKIVKVLIINCIFHLIICPILHGIHERKGVQTIMLLCKHSHNQI